MIMLHCACGRPWPENPWQMHGFLEEHMTRRMLREHCFKLLFGLDFYKAEEKEEQIQNYFASPEEENPEADEEEPLLHNMDFAQEEREEIVEKVRGILRVQDSLDTTISTLSKGWKLERMGGVERNILRLAIYEIKEDTRVPGKVAINEAVELSKIFGGADSFSFVNGILAKVV